MTHNRHGTDLERWHAIREQARDTLRRMDATKRRRNRAILQQARDNLRRTDLTERGRRRAIVAKARETLRRGQATPAQYQEKNERRRVIEKARKAVQFWQRKTPRAPSAAETKQFIDDRIAAAFEAREWLTEAHNDAIGQVVAGIRQQLRDEISAEIGKVQAQIDSLRSGRAGAEIVSVPKFLKSRRAA